MRVKSEMGKITCKTDIFPLFVTFPWYKSPKSHGFPPFIDKILSIAYDFT